MNFNPRPGHLHHCKGREEGLYLTSRATFADNVEASGMFLIGNILLHRTGMVMLDLFGDQVGYWVEDKFDRWEKDAAGLFGKRAVLPLSGFHMPE